MIGRGDFIEKGHTIFIEEGKNVLKAKKKIDSLSSSHACIWFFIDAIRLTDNID